jgi:hypothetical protein
VSPVTVASVTSDATQPRPVLFCDVDGVLSPRRQRGGAELRTSRHVGRIPDDVVVLARRLAERFEWWWCTSWEHDANAAIAPVLGLDPAPVLRLSLSGARSWKLSAVAAAAERLGRPVAWVDDHVGPRGVAWAALRPDRLVVPVDSAVGLTAAHVVRLEEFADRWSGGPVRHDQPGVPRELWPPRRLGVRRAAFVAVRSTAAASRSLRRR